MSTDAGPGARRRGLAADRWRFAGLLLAVALAGGGLRLAVLEGTFPVGLVGDERYYATVAARIAAGHGHMADPGTRAMRPPLFPFALSLFVDRGEQPGVIGVDRFVRPLVRVQVALGTLLVALTGVLGRRLFDGRTGLLAAGAAAAWPTFVAYSHGLWSETLFACALLGALTLAVRAADVAAGRGGAAAGGAPSGLRGAPSGRAPAGLRGAPAAALGAGVLFGAAALTREVGLLLAGVAAAWLVAVAPARGRGPALGRAALLLLATALVIAPWTIRNHRLFGRVVPISNLAWYTTAAGNLLDHPEWLAPPIHARRAFKGDYARIEDEMERADYARRRALEAIRAEQPWWLAKKLVRNGALLWGPDSFLAYKLRLGSYGPVAPVLAGTLVAASAVAYAGVLVAGVLGIAGAGRGRALLAVGLLGTITALHVWAIANSRHRMPVEPLLLVFAAHAALAPAAVRARLGRGRTAAAGAALLFFAAVCVPYAAVYSHGAAVLAGRSVPAAVED